MKPIKDLLNKFFKLAPKNHLTKKAIKESIQEGIGIKIEDKQINVSGKIAYIKISPVIKNEIFLKREQILKILKTKKEGGMVEEIK